MKLFTVISGVDLKVVCRFKGVVCNDDSKSICETLLKGFFNITNLQRIIYNMAFKIKMLECIIV